MPYDIQLKRLYGDAANDEGSRVLVDRLWPRGKRRDELNLHSWIRELAPSSSLRRRLHHQEISFAEFTNAYRAELQQVESPLWNLMALVRNQPVTLLTAARNPEASHLAVLRDYMLEMLREEDMQAKGAEPSSPVCYQQSDNF